MLFFETKNPGKKQVHEIKTQPDSSRKKTNTSINILWTTQIIHGQRWHHDPAGHHRVTFTGGSGRPWWKILQARMCRNSREMWERERALGQRRRWSLSLELREMGSKNPFKLAGKKMEGKGWKKGKVWLSVSSYYNVKKVHHSQIHSELVRLCIPLRMKWPKDWPKKTEGSRRFHPAWCLDSLARIHDFLMIQSVDK